jgi:hypothetical protein
MSSSLGEVLAGWQTVLRAGGRARTGVPEGQRIEAIVLNSNLASTFAEIAGIAPP